MERAARQPDLQPLPLLLRLRQQSLQPLRLVARCGRSGGRSLGRGGLGHGRRQHHVAKLQVLLHGPQLLAQPLPTRTLLASPLDRGSSSHRLRLPGRQLLLAAAACLGLGGVALAVAVAAAAAATLRLRRPVRLRRGSLQSVVDQLFLPRITESETVCSST